MRAAGRGLGSALLLLGSPLAKRKSQTLLPGMGDDAVAPIAQTSSAAARDPGPSERCPSHAAVTSKTAEWDPAKTETPQRETLKAEPPKAGLTDLDEGPLDLR